MDKREKTVAEEIAEKTYESWIVDSVEKEPDDCKDCDGDCDGSCES